MKAAPKPCRYPGCALLVVAGFCDQHQQALRRRNDEQRGSSSERGYNGRWQKARATFLRRHPLCQCSECTELGRVLIASVVDHRIPHKGDQHLFWDTSNWQAMSKTCHNKKTAREDGGFGRALRPASPPPTP